MIKCEKCNREIIVGITPHQKKIRLDARKALVYIPADKKYDDGLAVLKAKDIYPEEFYVPHFCQSDDTFLDADEGEE